MDALIPAFIAVLLAETGDRTQSQVHQLGLTFSDHRPIYAALIVASAINLLVGAYGGMLIAKLITYEARTLFAGLALMFGGLPMLFKIKPARPINAKRPFLTSLVHIIPAQIAGAAPFIVAGFAARSNMAGLTFAAGFAGVMITAILPLLLREEWPGGLPLVMLRQIAAALLIGAGLWMALGALRLIQ